MLPVVQRFDGYPEVDEQVGKELFKLRHGGTVRDASELTQAL